MSARRSRRPRQHVAYGARTRAAARALAEDMQYDPADRVGRLRLRPISRTAQDPRQLSLAGFSAPRVFAHATRAPLPRVVALRPERRPLKPAGRNARERFMMAIEERGGISFNDAGVVLDVFKKHRLVKLSGDEYHAAHGAVLDREVILRALEEGRSLIAKNAAKNSKSTTPKLHPLSPATLASVRGFSPHQVFFFVLGSRRKGAAVVGAHVGKDAAQRQAREVKGVVKAGLVRDGRAEIE